MKKVLSIIIALVCVTTAVNAQAPTHKFSVQLITPAASSTIANGSSINQYFVITIDQGSVGANDSVAYVDPFTAQGQVTVRWNVGIKNQGDTIQMKRTYTGISAPTGTFNYCVAAQIWNRSANYVVDSTTAPACNSVTVTGTPSSINDYFMETGLQTQKVNIYPNPAVGNDINVDYVAQNNSEVIATVYDLTGRKVLSHSYGKAFKGQDGFSLDISALNSGMYIMELRQDGIKATGQFVK